jgi:hypothetical protein
MQPVLTPQTYYDPLGDGETYERDAIPRFDHAYQYTSCSPDDLRWTLLEVETVDCGAVHRIVIRTQFLDGLRSMMTHRADSDGHEEIIHSTEIDPGRWHIVRTTKPPLSLWSVTLNSVTDERPDKEAAGRGNS